MFRESGTSIKARSWVSAPAAQVFSPAVYTQVVKVFWLSRNPLWKDRRPKNLSKRINNFFSLWLRGLLVYVYMYFNLRLWCFNMLNTMVIIIAYEITRTYEKDNGSLLGTWLEFLYVYTLRILARILVCSLTRFNISICHILSLSFSTCLQYSELLFDIPGSTYLISSATVA